MQEALNEAQKSLEEDEVPIGAVIVYKDKIIARGHNQVERLKDPTAHAEMLALTSATNYLNTKWLNDASLYVTINLAVCVREHSSFRASKIYTLAQKIPKLGRAGQL